MAESKVQETLKKLIYVGVGLAAQTAERYQHTVDDLVKKGKITDKEGKKIVDDLLKKTEDRRDELEKKFNQTIKKLGYVSVSEMEKLSRRIEKLENELKASKKAAPAAKKAGVSKSAPKKESGTPAA